MNDQWMKLLVQLRKRYTALTEIYDLTVQMGEALDRDDGTSFGMLLSMRQEPLLRMQELDENIRRIGKTDAPDIRERWDALLDGQAPRDADEDMVVKQMQQNRRLIERLVPLDSRINQSLAGRK
ncbi:MAG TPA: hypothetical protein H9790_05810 [Candidatus Agathobaculum intestinipullorum]|nr:hypothetical protein [uncultured Agathobaculum sp.]HJA48826.1 hypothetical protein [Candidatus Agathobaculum intestinipullorum]